MLSPERIRQLHYVAKIIEQDSTEGIDTASRVLGEDVAMGILIFWLRISHGSTSTFPARPEVEQEVNAVLDRCGLIAK